MRQVSTGAMLIPLLAGCSSIVVSRDNNSPDWPPTIQVPGIPFYAKQAQYTHDTKLVRREIAVAVTVTGKRSDGTSQVAHYPHTGPLVVPATEVGKVEARLAILAAEPVNDFDGASRAAARAMKELEGLRHLKAATELVSNTIGYTMVIGPDRFYINTRQPLIGSANSTYKISADGTLTEGTANVTDDTVKTLLSLLPINAKLSKEWGIQATQGYDGGASQFGTLDYVVTSLDTLYTLRRIPPKAGDAVPLLLDDAAKGANGVQLVSVEILNAGNKKDEARAADDKPAYKVNGTITLPPPPK